MAIGKFKYLENLPDCEGDGGRGVASGDGDGSVPAVSVCAVASSTGAENATWVLGLSGR